MSEVIFKARLPVGYLLMASYLLHPLTSGEIQETVQTKSIDMLQYRYSLLQCATII